MNRSLGAAVAVAPLRSRPKAGRRGNLVYAYLASAVAVVTIACSSRGGPHSAPTGSASPTAASRTGAASISLSSLPGEILFTRAGGSYGDETAFTAGAEGRHVRRIYALGLTSCPRRS